MKTLDLTLPTPEEYLACDESLLDHCEEGFPHEVLRFWEPSRHFVVLGYSNKMRSEINELSSGAGQIPVLRRASGGGTVLQGPGCLNYSVILKIPAEGPLSGLTGTNCEVMRRNRAALAPLLGPAVEVCGTSDLVIGGRKFSGNAQRRKRAFLLFHGTFLLDFDIDRVQKVLAMPSRQPEYRNLRTHTDFLTNIRLSPASVKEALVRAWGASEPMSAEEVPHTRIATLVQERYSQKSWNFKF